MAGFMSNQLDYKTLHTMKMVIIYIIIGSQ